MKNGHHNLNSPPPILAGARDLLSQYDALFCDVWGVVHDGLKAHRPAGEALEQSRKAGGQVVLVSNAPVPGDQVASMLLGKGLSRAAWDAIVSSGDIALRHVADRQYSAVFPIGPQDRDASLFDALSACRTGLEDADAIVCSGLNDDVNERAEDYDKLLERALERGLPFVCANPDKVVDFGGRLYLCAGAIADRYAGMGGEVFYAGKPHLSAYGSAHGIAETVRGAAVDKARILVIGDAVRTDLKGAEVYGVDALFIGGGIHRHDVMRGTEMCPQAVADLFATSGVRPAIASMAQLAL